MVISCPILCRQVKNCVEWFENDKKRGKDLNLSYVNYKLI